MRTGGAVRRRGAPRRADGPQFPIDRLTDDVALGLAEARGRLPNPGDGRLVQRERDAYHNR